MASLSTNYSDWIRDNQDVLDKAMSRVQTPPAPQAQTTPAPAPAQPAQPAPVTIQVNAQPTTQATPPPPTPTPTAPPSPPPVAPVRMPGSGNLRAQQAKVQSDRIADMNAIGQSHLREGEAAAQGAARNAVAMGEVDERVRPIAEGAQANADANRAQSEKYKRYMEEDIEALRKPLIDDRSGWEKAGGILSGIVAAMFQGRGMLGNAISYGMGALEDHINKNIHDQLNAKDQAGKSLPHVQKAMDQLAKDSNDQTEIAAKLMANQYLMAENELKRIGQETKVPEIRENAYRLAMASRDKANEYAETIMEARLKAAARNPRTDWSKFPPAQLEAWEASGKLPGAGVEYLDKLRSGKLGNQDRASQIAEREGKRGTPAPVGDEVEDHDLYTSTSDTEKAEYRAKQRDTRDLKASIGHIRKLLEKFGTESTGKNAEVLKTYAGTLMGQYNRGAKFGAMDNGTMGLLQDVIGDPNALFTGGPTTLAKLDAVEKSADESLNNHRVSLGLRSQAAEDILNRSRQKGARDGTPAPAPMGPPTPPSPVADPAPAQKVPMVTPGGQKKMISPHLVEEARTKLGMLTLEEYQDAQRELEYQNQLAQNAQAYSEGR